MPDPAKIEAVKNITSPPNIKDIRSLLGLAGYYRKFIPTFSLLRLNSYNSREQRRNLFGPMRANRRFKA